jgi:uncharacterized protein (TIGR00369 family)
MPPPRQYRYKVITPDEIAGLTGRQAVQAMIDGELPHSPMCETMNFWVVEAGDGFAAFEGDPVAHLQNSGGAMQGGWALTLIDIVASAAGWTLLPAGVRYVALETKGNFTRPITLETGRVRAESRVVSGGRQIITCEAWVRSLKSERVLAHGTCTLLVLQPAGGSATATPAAKSA